jgi:hypothetical protein
MAVQSHRGIIVVHVQNLLNVVKDLAAKAKQELPAAETVAQPISPVAICSAPSLREEMPAGDASTTVQTAQVRQCDIDSREYPNDPGPGQCLLVLRRFSDRGHCRFFFWSDATPS